MASQVWPATSRDWNLRSWRDAAAGQRSLLAVAFCALPAWLIVLGAAYATRRGRRSMGGAAASVGLCGEGESTKPQRRRRWRAGLPSGQTLRRACKRRAHVELGVSAPPTALAGQRGQHGALALASAVALRRHTMSRHASLARWRRAVMPAPAGDRRPGKEKKRKKKKTHSVNHKAVRAVHVFRLTFFHVKKAFFSHFSADPETLRERLPAAFAWFARALLGATAHVSPLASALLPPLAYARAHMYVSPRVRTAPAFTAAAAEECSINTRPRLRRQVDVRKRELPSHARFAAAVCAAASTPSSSVESRR